MTQTILAQCLIGAALFVGLALLQGVDVDWDVLNYHFYNGFAAVHGRTFANVQPAMLQSYLAPFLDAAFYLLVRLLPPAATLATLALVQSLAFPLLFLLAHAELASSRRATRSSARPCSPSSARRPRSPSSRQAAHTATRPAPSRSSLPFCSPPAPADASFVLGLLAASGATALARKASGPLAFCAGAGGAFALIYGGWAVLLWKHFGNPFFPLFNNVFRSPYAAPLGFVDPAFVSSGWKEKLLLPLVKAPLIGISTPAGFFDARLAIALPIATLALAVLVVRKGRHAYADRRFVLLIFFPAAYTAWLLASGINRYAVTLDYLAPIVTVTAASTLLPSARPLAAGSLALLTLIPLSQAYGYRLWWRPSDRRSSHGADYFGPTPRTLSAAAPAGATIAILGDGPIAYVIPYFPRSTTFVRLQGSLFYSMPGYTQLTTRSNPAVRRAAFGNALGRLICRKLAETTAPLLTLIPPGPSSNVDTNAELFFGLQPDLGHCRTSDSGIRLCPTSRILAEC